MRVLRSIVSLSCCGVSRVSRGRIVDRNFANFGAGLPRELHRPLPARIGGHEIGARLTVGAAHRRQGRNGAVGNKSSRRLARQSKIGDDAIEQRRGIWLAARRRETPPRRWLRSALCAPPGASAGDWYSGRARTGRGSQTADRNEHYARQSCSLPLRPRLDD